MVLVTNELCYLGDMLSVDGVADAAATARTRSGCFQFRSLASFLAARDISLLLTLTVYDACEERCVLHLVT